MFPVSMELNVPLLVIVGASLISESIQRLVFSKPYATIA